MSALTDLGIAALRDGVKDGAFSAREVATAFNAAVEKGRGLNAFVVLVGFLILSGAVNTSIIGSTGVLMRIAEDGVLTDWFRRPHHKFGTSYRIVNLVAGLQLFTIVASRGNVILLGKAYAFGVVWSFFLKSLGVSV